MSTYGRLAFNTLVALGIACCAASVPTREARADVKALTIEDDGGVVELAVGDTFTLTLESIPGAGFSWKVVESAEGHIASLGEPRSEPCPGDRPAGELGAPSCQVFEFRAENAGTVPLKLHYKRWWEEATPPEKTFTVELRIR